VRHHDGILGRCIGHLHGSTKTVLHLQSTLGESDLEVKDLT
jgi:hypothetical protein